MNTPNKYILAAIATIEASATSPVILRVPKHYKGKITSFAGTLRKYGYLVGTDNGRGRDRVLYVRKNVGKLPT